ncbi:ribonuclease domain-containing protein [Corynebacterium sp. UBA2622]|uniref:ribonuclease domain-containing protein n=1 Tax=Corynebacterium sp. UBA2622 TaxID=1946393 RepID=UPI0025BA3073|nr:ribonuclease domain-containing protein [Corynebacterium sp. UBA2622]
MVSSCGLNDASPTASTAAGAVPACSNLPDEVWSTIDEVKRGGPYEYPGYDDTRFGNYQNELPQEKLGYYREYTVDTPGVHHRGERRIITGGGDDGHVDEWYYTGDHYESFCEISGVK